jgi:hypothetical protein
VRRRGIATCIGDYPTASAWLAGAVLLSSAGAPLSSHGRRYTRARSPLMTYPVAVKLHPGLSDLQQVGVSSVQRAALAAHGRLGTTQRDPHWRAWTSSSLPSWSPGFSCWSQPRGCSPWQGTLPSRRSAGLRGPPAALRRLSAKRSRHIRGYRSFGCAAADLGPQSDGADIRTPAAVDAQGPPAGAPCRRHLPERFRAGRDRPGPVPARLPDGAGGHGVEAPREHLPRRPVPALDQNQEPGTSRFTAGSRTNSSRNDRKRSA